MSDHDRGTASASPGHAPENRFPYLRLSVLCRPQAEGGELGGRPLTAALARRILLKGLVDGFCPFGRALCEEKRNGPCDLASVCPYALLSVRPRRPPRFALYLAPATADGALLEITLFGRATRLHAWTLWALRNALLNGVGRKRVPYEIVRASRVDEADHVGPMGGRADGLHPTMIEPSSLEIASEVLSSPGGVAIDFLSPCRIELDGRPLVPPDPIPLVVLIHRIVDRTRAVFGGLPIPTPAFRSLLAAASDVAVLWDETEIEHTRDYSARSQKVIPLAGRTGRTVYGTGAARFLPLLRLGEILQVGKNVASGCGRIQVRLVEDGDARDRVV